MPDFPRSAVRRRLATELRRLREHAGLSGDEVAARLGWSGSKVSRIETYRTGVKSEDLVALLNLYEIDDRQRDQLTALAGEQESRGWWASYSDALPPDLADYISLENDADSLRCWSSAVIHGLLQTEDYARVVIETQAYSTAPIPKADVERRVQARMRRQAIITRPDPIHVTVVLDEAVLLRKIGDQAIMRAQLGRLLEWSRTPSVTLRVLALAENHPIGTGAFSILRFAPVYGTELNDLVYVEQLVRSSFIEDRAEALLYEIAYDRLAAAALDPDSSAELIARTATQHWA